MEQDLPLLFGMIIGQSWWSQQPQQSTLTWEHGLETGAYPSLSSFLPQKLMAPVAVWNRIVNHQPPGVNWALRRVRTWQTKT